MSKDGKNTNTESKKRKIARTNNGPSKKLRRKPENTIEKSKQLVEKLQSSRQKLNRTNKNVTRVCDNGKPMPTLAELEMMFEDSEDDEEPKIVTVNDNSLLKSSSVISPSTIKKIADKMMDMISNMPVPENVYRPAVVPSKKKHNVEATENQSNILPENKADNFDKIEDMNTDSSNKEDLSISISNNYKSKSEYIASWLKFCENTDHSDGSLDSNKTIDYDLNKFTNVSGRSKNSFFPLPSTSRDSETINKNDQLFTESFLSETLNETSNEQTVAVINNDIDDSDVKIIETPCETIVIDDDIDILKPRKRRNMSESDILECIDIIDPNNKKESLELTQNNNGVIDVDDYEFENPVCGEVTEVIDIDSIIAENKAIINKHSTDLDRDINTVTYVDSSTLSNLNNNETLNTSTVIINDDYSSTQNNAIQDRLQPIVTESSRDNAVVSDLQMNDVRVPSVHNINSRTDPEGRICNKNRQHHTASEHDNTKRFKRRKGNSSNPQQPSEQQAALASPVKSLGDCPICMDSLMNKTLASTMCGHVFCLKCIDAAFKTSGKRCPTCRKALKKGGYHQIFL